MQGWRAIGDCRIRPQLDYELLFIDQLGQICTIRLTGAELPDLPAGTQPLALRPLTDGPILAEFLWDPLNHQLVTEPRQLTLRVLVRQTPGGYRLEYLTPDGNSRP